MADCKVDMRSTFEKLPLEIRSKVYEELLKADNVRQPPNQNFIRDYHFETAILAASTQIHDEAYNTLYRDNHFIVVSCNSESITKATIDYEVATLASNKHKLVGKFKEHILRLHVSLPRGTAISNQAGNSKAKVTQSFILVAEELPRFVRILQILKAKDAMGVSKLSFRVKAKSGSAPPLAVQKLILDPLRTLVMHEGLVFSGAIDSAYADSVRASMLPEVCWVRELAWERCYLLLSIFDAGNEAFGLGHFRRADINYLHCLDFIEGAVLNDPRLGDFEKKGFQKSCRSVVKVAKINRVLALLRMKDWANVILSTSTTPSDAGSKPWVGSLVHHWRAIALAAQNQNIPAFKHLARAGRMNPANNLIQRHIAEMRKRIDGSDMTSSIHSDATLEQLHELVCEPPPVLLPCEHVAGERYVLRHFGYTGDFIEDIKETAPVDEKAMKILIEGMEKAKKKSTTRCLWVGSHMSLYQ